MYVILQKSDFSAAECLTGINKKDDNYQFISRLKMILVKIVKYCLI
jgi:hypothetical protein